MGCPRARLLWPRLVSLLLGSRQGSRAASTLLLQTVVPNKGAHPQEWLGTEAWPPRAL